jgi:hypothetical protein
MREDWGLGVKESEEKVGEAREWRSKLSGIGSSRMWGCSEYGKEMPETKYKI